MGVTPPIPVRQLNNDAFLGRWYQTHTSLAPIMSVEKNGYCICSDYNTLNPRAIRVNSYANDKSPSGMLRQIGAIAQSTNEPGRFDLVFDSTNKRAQALVILVSSIERGQYQWVAITDPLGVNLFVMARNVPQFKQRYERSVLFQLAIQGFIYPFNRPRETYHGSDCAYPPVYVVSSDMHREIQSDATDINEIHS